MSESKRTSIPKEEKISKLDNTIKYHEDMIKKLKVKKNNIVNPSPRAGRSKGVKRVIAESKLPDDALLAVFGFEDMDSFVSAVNKAKSVCIGDNVWIAQRSTIMKGVKIGNGAIVGLGSIVTKDIPEHSFMSRLFRQKNWYARRTRRGL